MALTSRNRRWWIKVVLALVSATFAWIVLEVASGFYFKHRVPPSLAKRAIEVEVYGSSAIPLSLDPHPYLLYVNHPGYEDQINSLGLRGPEIQKEKAAGSRRVLFLGGSTTYSTSVREYTNAWPWQLGVMTKREAGLDLEILNGGLPYATTAESLASYVFRYRYLKPDVVVIEAGGNDQVATWYPGYNSEYTHFRGPGGGWRFSRIEKVMLCSNVAKVLYCRWIAGKFRTYSAHPADYGTLDRMKTLEMVRTNSLEGFRRNLELLVRMAQNDGSKVLLVGFVNGEKLSKNRPELEGFEPVIYEGTRRHRMALSEIGKSAGAKVVIPRQEQFTDEMFADDCHLTAAGERVKASECLPALLSLLQ